MGFDLSECTKGPLYIMNVYNVVTEKTQILPDLQCCMGKHAGSQGHSSKNLSRILETQDA